MEFGLLAPLLVLMLMAIIQFGITLNNYLELTDAVRVAARNFAISGTSTNGIEAIPRSVLTCIRDCLSLEGLA